MEKISEKDLDRWVEQRLAALHPDSQWQPNAILGLARFRGQHDAEMRRARRWAWVAAGAMVTCLGLLAFPVTRAFAERCVAACVSETGRVWRSFSQSDSARAGLKPENDRTTAPDFTLPDAFGEPVRLSEFRGKVVLLNFWATWCGPCKIEIPWFMEFQQTYPDREFVVLGVSLDDDGWKSVKPFIGEKKINYPVMVGNSDIARLYGGPDALPATFLIDKSGRIAAAHIGLISKSRCEADIQAMLAE